MSYSVALKARLSDSRSDNPVTANRSEPIAGVVLGAGLNRLTAT